MGIKSRIQICARLYGLCLLLSSFERIKVKFNIWTQDWTFGTESEFRKSRLIFKNNLMLWWTGIRFFAEVTLILIYPSFVSSRSISGGTKQSSTSTSPCYQNSETTVALSTRYVVKQHDPLLSHFEFRPCMVQWKGLVEHGASAATFALARRTCSSWSLPSQSRFDRRKCPFRSCFLTTMTTRLLCLQALDVR